MDKKDFKEFASHYLLSRGCEELKDRKDGIVSKLESHTKSINDYFNQFSQYSEQYFLLKLMIDSFQKSLDVLLDDFLHDNADIEKDIIKAVNSMDFMQTDTNHNLH